MKRSASLLFACILLSSFISCGQNDAPASPVSGTSAASPADQTAETEPETEDTRVKDNLGEYNFGGEVFNMMTFQNRNIHNEMLSEEQDGTSINDAVYKATLAVEERFNIDLTQTLYEDFANTPRVAVTAGDDTIDLVRIRCDEAVNWWTDGLIVTPDETPNIDLSMPYWYSTVNDSLSIADQHYVAVSAFDLGEYDFTYCLVFNKDMIGSFSMSDPYKLVRDGVWTMDTMNQMMLSVSADTSGDGIMDQSDRWGYLGHPKNVAPSFWIGADVMSVTKDENDIPYLNIGSERFIQVWEKILNICYSENQYLGIDEIADIPPTALAMFSAGQSLFMDMSLFHIESLRAMESDFGIIPYPKYDETQKEYRSRVCYYMPTLVPVTKAGDAAERCGVILEALACQYYNDVVPAYYDIVLQTKVARDNESQEMLDLILTTRVIDIGDTTLCFDLRSGPLEQMFRANNGDLASKEANISKVVTKKLSKLPGVG